mmetsp:Transcript_22292/g.40501  ORF Transcript_22292/g.40501 Transcript_22292/m.40501 type:complete len:112 (-) Transcript_22292:618-953(-)
MRPHSRIGFGTCSSDHTDIECPEEGVRDEDVAANATQPGAFHVEGMGSNRDEASLWMNMAASAAVASFDYLWQLCFLSHKKEHGTWQFVLEPIHSARLDPLPYKFPDYMNS